MKKLFLGFCSVLAMASAIMSCSKSDDVSVVESVTLAQTELAINVGETSQTVAVALPVDAENLTLTWTSSDATVATVVNGLVTALKVGTTDIVVKSINDKSATCKVTVSAAPILAIGITCDDEDVEFEVGKTHELTFCLVPADANAGIVTNWESTDADIASVDNNGVITGVAKGEATIKATIENGASFTVDVKILPSAWEMDTNMVGQMVCVKLQARYVKDGSMYEEDTMDQLFVIDGDMAAWCAKIKAGMTNVINADATMTWTVALTGDKTQDLVGDITRNDNLDNALLVNYHSADCGINFGERQSDIDAVKLGWTVGGTEVVYDEPSGSFYDFIYTCTITKAGVTSTATKVMSYKEVHSLKCAK